MNKRKNGSLRFLYVRVAGTESSRELSFVGEYLVDGLEGIMITDK